MNLGEARNIFLKGYFSVNDRQSKTKAAYKVDTSQFETFTGSNTELNTLNNKTVEGWAEELKFKGYAPASIRRKLVALKVFFDYWVRDGLLEESPFWRVKVNVGKTIQLPRTLSESEMRGLLSRTRLKAHTGGSKPARPEIRASSPDFLWLRNNAILELLFATGIRAGELSSIDLTDFKFDENYFRIQGKGRKERIAFIVDDATERIQHSYLIVRQSLQINSPALFINASGGRLSPQGVANVVARLRLESGIKRHITPHMLRHTVATLLLRNGTDIRVVQEFLGHASIATTQRYTHVTKEHMRSELMARHPSLGLLSADNISKTGLVDR